MPISGIFRQGDRVVVQADHPEGRYAPGTRFVRVIALAGPGEFLGLGWDGGKETDPVVTWLRAGSEAIIQHERRS